jgi:hypothetical protein
MKGLKAMKKHILYIGLNDKDSKQQEISTLDAYKIIFNAVKKYYDGATITESRGFYTHESGAVTFENSLVCSILFADDDKTRQLAEDLKILLNQETIALEIQDINSNLI